MARTILHVDMDAFYASVEQRDDPALRGKPVIVGGPSRRGVVTAASYEARPFGVRSAMSMVDAMRRCPQAIVVPPRMGRYAEASAAVFAIFERVTPLVQGLSLDEAFLDVTASRALFGEGEAIARRIKAEIHGELGLRASAGVAASKFVAKIASDLRKPDALVVVAPGEEKTFLAPLPIERMWGVGPRASERLRASGFDTIGDLAAALPAALERALGSWGATVHELANGVDDRPVVPDHDAKSIGAEETFEQDARTAAALEPHLLEQSARVASRLVREGLAARVVHVKVKYGDFTVKTRQSRLPDRACDTDTIYRAARALLDRFPALSRGVRLTGVSVSDLGDAARTETLFPDARIERGKALEQVVRAIEARHGDRAVTRARLLDAPPPRDRGRARPDQK